MENRDYCIYAGIYSYVGYVGKRAGKLVVARPHWVKGALRSSETRVTKSWSVPIAYNLNPHIFSAAYSTKQQTYNLNIVFCGTFYKSHIMYRLYPLYNR